MDEIQYEDKIGRNLFTQLTVAVTSAHDKEKNHAKTVKYWSILMSILGKHFYGKHVNAYWTPNELFCAPIIRYWFGFTIS